MKRKKHRSGKKRTKRTKRRHHRTHARIARRTRRNRRRSRGRRSNPGMPIVLVNPSGERHMKKGRRRKGSRRGKRGRHHVRGHYRRSNPSSTWGRAAAAAGLGALGGGVAYGIDFGVSYAPVGPTAQSAIIGAAGAVTSIAVAKYADERAGAGIAGGTGFALIGRVREQLALAAAAKATGTGTPQEGGAVRRMGGQRVRMGVEGGAVYRDAGAIQKSGARSMAGSPMAAKSYRESGHSRYINGPIRFFGPRSWVYNTEGGSVVFRSAHNR